MVILLSPIACPSREPSRLYTLVLFTDAPAFAIKPPTEFSILPKSMSVALGDFPFPLPLGVCLEKELGRNSALAIPGRYPQYPEVPILRGPAASQHRRPYKILRMRRVPAKVYGHSLKRSPVCKKSKMPSSLRR
jgi:hypothetical protein